MKPSTFSFLSLYAACLSSALPHPDPPLDINTLTSLGPGYLAISTLQHGTAASLTISVSPLADTCSSVYTGTTTYENPIYNVTYPIGATLSYSLSRNLQADETLGLWKPKGGLMCGELVARLGGEAIKGDGGECYETGFEVSCFEVVKV